MIVAEASAVRSIASIAFSTLRKRNLPVSAIGARILTRRAPPAGPRRGLPRQPALRPETRIQSIQRGVELLPALVRRGERLHPHTLGPARPRLEDLGMSSARRVLLLPAREQTCFELPGHGSGSARLPRALDFAEERPGLRRETVDLPSLPGARRREQRGPEPAVNPRRLPRDELREEDVAMVKERLSGRENRVPERMPPPRAAHGPARHQGDQARELRVRLEQEAPAVELADDCRS